MTATLSTLPPLAPAIGYVPVTIGPYRGLVLSDGALPLPVDAGPLPLPALGALLPDLPEAEYRALMQRAGLGEATHIDQNILLLEIAGEKVLFDVGCGEGGIFGPDSGRLPQSLAEAGIAPEEIGVIVFSHAHSDHFWGVTTPGGQPVFPRARYFMSRAEHGFWTGKPASETGVSVTAFRQRIGVIAPALTLYDDGQEILPGLVARATPGHTPGHCSFEIRWPGGRFLVLGDVLLHHAVSLAAPAVSSLFDGDRAQASATRLAMLAEMAAEDLPAIGYHMPWPGLFRVRRAEGPVPAYHYVPSWAPQPGR